MSARTAALIYVTVKDRSGNSERITEQTHRVKALEYTDSLSKADKCVLTIDNFDLSNFDDPVWAHRNFVQVSWGYPGNMALARECVITKVTGFLELKIEARGKSVLIDAVKKSRTFKGLTRSEVVEKIAREYGYDETTLHIEPTRKKLAFVTQPNISDAQLIRKLAHQQGFDFYVDLDGLHFHERKLVQDPLRAFVWYTDARRGDVINVIVDQDITRRPGAVKRKGRDPLSKETKVVEASNAKDAERQGTGETVLITSPDLRSGTFQTTYVPVDEGPLMCTPDGGGAEVEAKAKFRASQRAVVKIALEAVGDPTMQAKALVTLSGVGQRLSGNYYVPEVIHSVAPGKYTMKLKLQSDGTGTMAARLAAQRLENGLPQVAAEPSKAKRTEKKAHHDTASIIAGQSVGPDGLVPVPIRDAQGREIGVGWAVRTPVTQTVRIEGDAFVTESE